MPPRWYTMTPTDTAPPLGVVVYPATDAVPRDRGIGLRIPPREADCSGVRPSWYPFQVNVCDWEFDEVEPDLTWREMTTEPPPG